jgi:hypothetical protein
LRDAVDDLAGAALGALGLGSFEPVVFLVTMQWKAPHERPDPPRGEAHEPEFVQGARRGNRSAFGTK